MTQSGVENETAIIRFSNLSKRYQQRKIFSEVSFDAYRGKSYLLTGKNGSGKSTLLRVMSGLLQPDTGSVDIQDQQSNPLGWDQQRAAIRSRVMYMHQMPYLFDGTVFKNLTYALTYEKDSKVKAQKIEQALDWADLNTLAQSQAKQLSGGEKQRVALARAWLRQSSVLLLDEPTANLDQTSRMKTLELLGNLKQSGVSLLIACHECQEFMNISDGILSLQNGSLRKV